MKKIRIKILQSVLVFSALLYGCSSISTRYPSGDFYFMVISDTHISDDSTKDIHMQKFITKINAGFFPGVELLLVTGDIVSSHYTKYDGTAINQSKSRLEKAVTMFDELNIPYHLVMGNHDYKIDSEHDSDYPFSLNYLRDMENRWRKITGRAPNYSFIHKGWKFIILSSFRGRQRKEHFSERQMDWLNKELKTGMPSLLFFHHPLKTDHFRIWCSFKTRINPDRDARFYTILQKHKDEIKAIFTGHGHLWVHDYLFETIPVYETDSFADNKNPQYLIAAVDNSAKTIFISKNAKRKD